MRTSSHFLSFFCFVSHVVSYATSQTSEWNGLKVQTEILKINEKFSDFSDKFDVLQRLSESNHNMEIERWKNETNDLKKQLSDLNQNLEKAQNEANNMKKEVEDLRGKLKQEVNDSRPYETKCEEREEALNGEMDLIKQELSEMKRRDAAMEKSVSVNKYHLYSRHFNEYNEKKEPDFTWTIDDIRNKTKVANFALLSEVFHLKGYSFGAQAKLTLDEDDYLEISLAYKKTYERGKYLNLELIPCVSYTYKEGPLRTINRDTTYLFGTVLQYDDFSYSYWLISPDKIANDTISLDIRVEKAEALLRGYSYDGNLVWAIDDFRSKKEMEEKRLVFRQVSPSFYTGPKEYRVRADAYLDGRGAFDGKGLTVCINFLTGPYDEDLSATFKHRTTVTLFHPTDPTKVIVKSVDKDIKDGKWYMVDVGTHAQVGNILNEDTLYYRIKIIPIK